MTQPPRFIKVPFVRPASMFPTEAYINVNKIISIQSYENEETAIQCHVEYYRTSLSPEEVLKLIEEATKFGASGSYTPIE